nr:PilZ domain-containing protein [uncultured Aminipila sp.]
MISNLNISDTVEICITDKELQKHYYRTKIQDIGLDNIFFTMIPSSETGRPVIFFKDQTYELYAKGKEGIILWIINYLGIEKMDNLSACKFQAITGPEVTQRREFFRQSVSVNLNFYITLSDSGTDTSIERYGRIVDLSGGGCAFICNDQMMLHSKLLIRFSFRGTDFEFHSEILDRIDFTKTRADWNYKYRVKWIDTNGKTVDNLIKLVFAQQREILINNASRGGDRFV